MQALELKGIQNLLISASNERQKSSPASQQLWSLFPNRIFAGIFASNFIHSWSYVLKVSNLHTMPWDAGWQCSKGEVAHCHGWD